MFKYRLHRVKCPLGPSNTRHLMARYDVILVFFFWYRDVSKIGQYDLNVRISLIFAVLVSCIFSPLVSSCNPKFTDNRLLLLCYLYSILPWLFVIPKGLYNIPHYIAQAKHCFIPFWARVILSLTNSLCNIQATKLPKVYVVPFFKAQVFLTVTTVTLLP